MTTAEIRKTTNSVVNWCMDVFVPKNASYTKAASLYGKERANARWAGHLSIKKEAKLKGCSEWTIRKDRKNGKGHAVARGDDFIFGNCSFNYQRLVYRDQRKDHYSKHGHLVAFDSKKDNVSPGIPYHTTHGDPHRPIVDIPYDRSICEQQTTVDEKVRGPPISCPDL
jgi:hypothetical protein